MEVDIKRCCKMNQVTGKCLANAQKCQFFTRHTNKCKEPDSDRTLPWRQYNCEKDPFAFSGGF